MEEGSEEWEALQGRGGGWWWELGASVGINR